MKAIAEQLSSDDIGGITAPEIHIVYVTVVIRTRTISGQSPDIKTQHS